MLDTIPDQQRMQRTRGQAHVALGAGPGGARLQRLRQSGSAKAMLPRVHGVPPEIVFLNTAGGLTGGDKLHYRLSLGAGARATATTQTAERAYASMSGAAQVNIELALDEGATLDWLPQETILFEHASLQRETTVAMAGTARLLLCETVILGRVAMGEVLAGARLHDTRTVLRDGRPVWLDPFCISPELLASGLAPAGLAGARAIACVALFEQGAEDALAPVRAALDSAGVQAGASGWGGKCVARMMAPNPADLRPVLARTIEVLRGGPLPRVWQI